VDVAPYLALVRRRWLPILACVLAGLAGAITQVQSTPRLFRAGARVYIRTPPSRQVAEALQGVELSSQLIRSYAQIATSRRVATRVVERLGLSENAEALRGQLSVTPEADTLLLTISASDASPKRAQTLANTAALAFIDVVADLESGSAGGLQPKIVDQATVPITPYQPRPRSTELLGLILGLAAGLTLALTLDGLDRTVRTPAEAQALAASPLLALLPHRRDAKRHPLLTAADVGSAWAESYRALRTSVRFVELDHPLRTVVMTSPSASDGKTTTAANLAIALADSGERVILVDADLRRTKLAEMFSVDAEPGLTSLVLGQSTMDEALRPISDRLAILPTGPLPPNPSEILGSKRMATVLTELTKRADIVLLDTPPIAAVTDSVVLATQVDGVILVVRHGKTHRTQIAEARRQLDVVGATVVGFALNGIPPRAEYSYDYRYTGVRRTQRRWPWARRADAEQRTQEAA
jgi:capsular exopolysaccharide synthesis family protein